jgi:hypothetical protein
MRYVEMLTEADIQFGSRLWHTLRESREFPIEGMFWVLREPRDWHLVIASPVVDTLGVRDALLKIYELTGNIPAEMSQHLKIMPVSPSDELYQAFRSIYSKQPSVEGRRMANTMVGGFYIDEAYLYEIK